MHALAFGLPVAAEQEQKRTRRPTIKGLKAYLVCNFSKQRIWEGGTTKPQVSRGKLNLLEHKSRHNIINYKMKTIYYIMI